MTEALQTVAWIGAGLALGCLPFSFWVGHNVSFAAHRLLPGLKPYNWIG